MPGASAQVSSVFSQAAAYASAAQTAVNAFTSALSASIYTVPTMDVVWDSPAAPTLPSVPTAPTLPDITFVAPAATPSALALAEPGITIDDFVTSEPTLTFPSAPTVFYDSAPPVPAVAAVTVPTAPTVAAVTLPTMLALSTITVPTIDLHESWLTQLETIPTLSLLAPTPYSYSRGAAYASDLLADVKAKLEERIAGGTGLSAAVEQAIWDRARDRETRTAQANIDQVARTNEALGFQLPTGTLASQLREAEQNYYDKLSEFSRDVSIKQAELEQANLKDTIAAGIQLEGQLIEYSWKMENLAFESAKQYAENAIQIHNATIEKFKALIDGYRAYASAYDTIIKGQMAAVDIYKAQLEGEQTKANINTALVQQYKAQIDAGLAQVEVYKAQVQGAQTLIQLEQTKVSAAAETIRAYVAQVNAETAKVEAYKASVQAESTKIEVFRAQVEAYKAKVGAQADQARAEVSRYSALFQAKASEWEGYKAQVGAESERIRALGIQSSSLLDGFKAEVGAVQAEAEMATTVWKGTVAQYEAGQNIAIQTAKFNTDAFIATKTAAMEAAKTGAQVYSQLTASAYSMMRASAAIQGTDQMAVQFQYSGQTSSSVSPTTSLG